MRSRRWLVVFVAGAFALGALGLVTGCTSETAPPGGSSGSSSGSKNFTLKGKSR